jgi:hypothetical protein
MRGYGSFAATDDAIESQHIRLVKTEVANDNKRNSKACLQRVQTILIIIVVVIASLAVTGSYTKRLKGDLAFFRPFQILPDIDLSCQNEYGDSSSQVLQYSFLENSLLVEPYRDTTITVVNSNTDCAYEWRISSAEDSAEQQVDSTFSGNPIVVQLATPGNYILDVEETCSDGTSRSLLKNVFVKYVRREIQSLNDKDREDFLDALLTLYNTNTKDGIAKYGSQYKSLYYLTTIHIDAAGNPACDEFHSGSGFFDNHVYFGNYLEQSLQLVNPRIALPYMEYSRYYSSDSYQQHMENQLDGGSWTELFSEKYFGKVDPTTGDILDGRFADVEIPYADSSFYKSELIDESKTFYPAEEAVWLNYSAAHLKSPYGLLRSPWSYNPSRRIGRYHNEAGIATVPYDDLSEFFTGTTCEDYEDFITNEVTGQSLDNFLKYVKSFHEAIHFNVGGQGGAQAEAIDQVLRSDYGFTDDDIFVIAETSQKFAKRYMPARDYYTDDEYPVYPLSCSADPYQGDAKTTNMAAPGADDGPSCSCVDYYFESQDQLYDLISMYFEKYMKSIYPQNVTPQRILSLDFEGQKGAMKLLCSRLGLDGDMVGSASPLDPVFWISHGALERLFHRISFANLLADNDYTTASDCSGHAPNGTKAWLNGYHLQDEKINAAELTNVELTRMLNPTTDEFLQRIPYIYDTASYGCDNVESLLPYNSR